MSFSYLKKINNHYYFRIRIPSDLEHLIGFKEIQKSLRTEDLRTAREQARRWASKTDGAIALIRTGVLTPDQLSIFIEDQFPRRQHRQPTEKPKTLSYVANGFIQEQVLVGRWTDKTRGDYEKVLGFFTQVSGDIPVNRIDRKVMVSFVEALCSLPANLNKKAEYRDKSITEILAMRDIEPMSTATVNKYLSRVTALLIWCVRQGYIDRNPADGLTIARNGKEEDERSAYSIDDLTRIKETLPPYPSDQPERYWIPLIGMYSGARLNEICQLYIDDLKEVEGILCFDINDEKDKRLKTISSRRIIPVHPRLVELGFLEYVEQLRESGSERLWPNLERGRDGYSHRFGKWFQYHNRKHITTDPKKCFHSFRHTVADTLKQAGVPESVIAEILGHANGSITTGRYGKRYRPSVLLDALVKLNY